MVAELTKKYDELVDKHRELYWDRYNLNGKTERKEIKRLEEELSEIRIEMRLIQKEIEVIQRYDRDEQLKSLLLPKIEKLWMYDSSFPLSEKDMGERAGLIETICYTIANEWIDKQ